MAELVIVRFYNPNGAGRILTEPTRLQRGYLIYPQDTVVATRSPVGSGALSGEMIGHCINDDSIRSFSDKLKPVSAGPQVAAGRLARVVGYELKRRDDQGQQEWQSSCNPEHFEEMSDAERWCGFKEQCRFRNGPIHDAPAW